MAFSPQYPLWSDGLLKKRWILIPAGQKIDTGIEGSMDQWEFPVGTKVWKEFSATERGGGSTKVETRYMEKLADGRWAYATFLWNRAQTEAAADWGDRGRNRHAKGAPGRMMPALAEGAGKSTCVQVRDTHTLPISAS